MKTWDGGAPGVVANNAKTFGLQNLQTAIVRKVISALFFYE